MNTYIIYVKSPNDKIVYDKRLEAEGNADLLLKAMEYFKYVKDYEVVRIEKIERVFGDADLHFGTNFIKVA